VKYAGYLVMESCEDYEQALRLIVGDVLPKGGILAWAENDRIARTMFASREDARAAIERTEHYRLAFGHQYPEKRFCRIVPVVAIPASEPEQP
jgi:hypothetical protein